MADTKLEELQNAITQQELDISDLNELLKEDPENNELVAMKKEAESTLSSLKANYDTYRLTILPEENKLTSDRPKQETIIYKRGEHVLAQNSHDNAWYAAEIVESLNLKCWVKFGPRHNQLLPIDKIKPFTPGTVPLATVQVQFKHKKLPTEKVSELPAWTKPKPSDSQKEILLKKKKRHQLKSVMKQQREEEDLTLKKNNWKNFAKNFKK
ncbi:hypothetical protein EIN_344370 [Entamoeba invadens IP1]|uniref:Tudor domain-containing protein n=1 Tax=Entamoeba invadens IP1 TaxID=370355 RepID=A0A0A1U372_ENTIV|nr:hypothetical protein EIN_344370 [Entamoeba invadens IP1]ELP88497.1 hypothetical protein EIN_344370 [Entamoeba invadens IP1]|eukprot:XP_004255268.1 hypothetical protein EIN_344370 [Entamoeba invadens IP1]